MDADAPACGRPPAAVTAELHTVADDEAVLYDGERIIRVSGLEPDRDHEIEGVAFRTLARPGGERLSTVATVNDVHFGETECGVVEGTDIGPVLRAAPDEAPYPETMNRGAVSEIAALAPDAVVVKGDLTAHGTLVEFDAFRAMYSDAFGERLRYVRGNHDAYYGETFADDAPLSVELPGATLAVIDTTIARLASGGVSTEQLDWLDELGARADRPVLVFGHHHVWKPGTKRSPTYFGINPEDSEKLVAVFERRPSLVGYFAGHTHRNRVRRFSETGAVPFVEVACVKDFPGTWAEYRVFEGGVLQVHRRISTPEALSWSERTRAMFGGLYADYALGSLDERCFAIRPR